jgi:hypothetical protein
MAKREPKIKEPQTYEEFLAREWKSFHVHSGDYDANVPPSNYPFKVGESVRYGARHEPRVEEVLKDGRLLHLSVHDRGTTYGKDWDNHRRIPVLVWWTSVDPIALEEDTAFGRPRINIQYTQTSMGALLHYAYWRGLLDSPDYQRDYVWTLEDKQRLVKSIMNRMDIGKFVFLERPYPENRYEVVDGKQRLNAILDFTQGRFPYEGKTWFQFSRDDKNVFEDLTVQIATMHSEKVSKADILWLFLSINTGGVPQTEEHVAKAQKLYLEALEAERGKAKQ